MNRRVHLRVQGIVQGVGFRPHVYRLAQKHQIGGWVRNQADGVEIEACGQAPNVSAFLEAIPAEAPPLARIVQLDLEDLPYQAVNGFEIVQTRQSQPQVALVSPDVGLCDDCLQELRNPSDRRFRYPFINCTNCGPRYSIIRDIPYDRVQTTMADFAMCPTCQQEYHDPSNRRFHAQPNACWSCGPQVWLESASGERIAERDAAIAVTTDQLAAGAIVAVKGLGGFHLAVVATDEAAVTRLRSRKVREEKPFAVMFADLAAIRSQCLVDDQEAQLLQGPARPIVLLTRRDGSQPPATAIAASVAPRNRLLGAFLPYTPLHHLLFDHQRFAALVLTSGNRSDEPIAIDNAEARERLGDIADYFLLHNRDIYLRCDDSVMRTVNRQVRQLRRSRGLAPVPLFLGTPLPTVLAVGGELKNTVCLVRGHEAFVSQHIGDLENLTTQHAFEQTVGHLERILHVEPEVIAHDLHPDYLSTQWAQQQSHRPRLAIQHHHAHIASVCAERHLSGPVLGLALDGTGYGSDGTIWGGEILQVSEHHWERLGHLRQVPLPGGNMAAREPWRMALAYLWSLTPDAVEPEYSDLLSRWPQHNVRLIWHMLNHNLYSPLTSSCGRLFDAMAALAGVRDVNVYEGQAAIEWEQLVEADDQAYVGDIQRADGILIVDPLPMLVQAIADIRANTPVGRISARFHNGLVALLTESLVQVAETTGLKRIALSGGVFQNAYLSNRLETRLTDMGFEIYTHLEVPPNDAGISLGQAWIAGNWWQAQQGNEP